jgi:thiol-disulfide isomerase/thioredoxin
MPRWEKPEKDMPSFRLSDLEGKVWNLKNLHGKTLLVCIWSTWSGPCQLLLPRFQALYDQLKERENLVVFTMNVDEDSSLVRPYLAKSGYNFPVVPALTFVGQLVGFLSVPRLWIIDEDGGWLWEQVGFDASAAGWEEDVVKRLDKAQAAEK